MIRPTDRITAMLLRRSLLAFVIAALAPASPPKAAERSITVVSTTSTEQSGLFAHLLPPFTEQTGIAVRVVALGTGQALDVGRRGDADVVFVHDRAAEDTFVAEGFATARADVMYNDFVLVGPRSDPAGTGGRDILAGLRRIVETKPPFISRGDRSGTHAAELRFWREAGIDPAAPKGEWYKEVGQGMGPTLNIASAQNAYTLADRGTWLSFRNRGQLAIVVEGDPKLFNPYGVMAVSPDKHPHVKAAEAKTFVDWLVSSEGQATIASYKIGGEQLFFPNARPARGS